MGMNHVTDNAIIAEFLDEAETIIKQKPFYMRFSRVPRSSAIQWLMELNESQAHVFE